MIQFAHPLWLLGLLVPLLRLIWLIADRRSGYAAVAFSSTSMLRQRHTWRSRTSLVPFILELLVLTLTSVALARPQRVIQTGDERRGIDIVVALDSSGSMAAEDFQPRNRFEVAKELLARFLEERVDDRIGIVTFGSRAATRVPITFDRDAAVRALEWSRLGENGDGTAIGHAIATAVNRLRKSEARSRVVVLLTDGVNNAGSIDPATATALAKNSGIRIYTIGVGSRGLVPVPVKVQNRFTGEIETEYRAMRVDLDEALLQGIAEQTGGAYFRATSEETLENVLGTIDKLEESRYEGERRRSAEELYRLPLSAAAIAFLLMIFAGETVWMRLPV